MLALLESPNPEKSQGIESWGRSLAGSVWGRVGCPDDAPTPYSQSHLIIISIRTKRSPANTPRACSDQHFQFVLISSLQGGGGQGLWSLLVRAPETSVTVELEGNHELLRPGCWSSIFPFSASSPKPSAFLLDMRGKRFEIIFFNNKGNGTKTFCIFVHSDVQELDYNLAMVIVPVRRKRFWILNPSVVTMNSDAAGKVSSKSRDWPSGLVLLWTANKPSSYSTTLNLLPIF